MIDFTIARGKENNILYGGKFLGKGKAVVYVNNIWQLQKFASDLMKLNWDLDIRTIISVCRSINHELMHVLLNTYNEWVVIEMSPPSSLKETKP